MSGPLCIELKQSYIMQRHWSQQLINSIDLTQTIYTKSILFHPNWVAPDAQAWTLTIWFQDRIYNTQIHVKKGSSIQMKWTLKGTNWDPPVKFPPLGTNLPRYNFTYQSNEKWTDLSVYSYLTRWTKMIDSQVEDIHMIFNKSLLSYTMLKHTEGTMSTAWSEDRKQTTQETDPCYCSLWEILVAP